MVAVTRPVLDGKNGAVNKHAWPMARQLRYMRGIASRVAQKMGCLHLTDELISAGHAHLAAALLPAHRSVPFGLFLFRALCKEARRWMHTQAHQQFLGYREMQNMYGFPDDWRRTSPTPAEDVARELTFRPLQPDPWLRARLSAALAELPQLTQQLLGDFYIDEWSLRRLARRYNMREKEIKHLVLHGTQHMKASLGEGVACP